MEFYPEKGNLNSQFYLRVSKDFPIEMLVSTRSTRREHNQTTKHQLFESMACSKQLPEKNISAFQRRNALHWLINLMSSLTQNQLVLRWIHCRSWYLLGLYPYGWSFCLHADISVPNLDSQGLSRFTFHWSYPISPLKPLSTQKDWTLQQIP